MGENPNYLLLLCSSGLILIVYVLGWYKNIAGFVGFLLIFVLYTEFSMWPQRK
jgi:hypothetical protein